MGPTTSDSGNLGGAKCEGLTGSIAALSSGGDDFQFEGQHQDHNLAVFSDGPTEANVKIDVAEPNSEQPFFNSNTFTTMKLGTSGGDCIEITGGSGRPVAGNQFHGLNMALGDRPLDVDAGIEFEGNSFRGYGAEGNSNPWRVPDGINGDGYNEIMVRIADVGFDDLAEWAFSTIKSLDTPLYIGSDAGEASFYVKDDFSDAAGTTNQRPDRRRSAYYPSRLNTSVVSRYRPSWFKASGSVTKTGAAWDLDDESTTGNAVRLQTPSDLDDGNWELTFQFNDATPTAGFLGFKFVKQDGNDYLRIRIKSGGGVELEKEVGGTLTGLVSGSWPNDTTEHTVSVERDTTASPTSYELFVNGSSQGTVTDSYDPTVNEMEIYFNNTDEDVLLTNLSVT